MVLLSTSSALVGAVILAKSTYSLPHEDRKPGVLSYPLSIRGSPSIAKRHFGPHNVDLSDKGLNDYVNGWTDVAVDILIGADNQKVTVFADTGSHVTWVNPTCDDIKIAYSKDVCQKSPRFKPDLDDAEKWGSQLPRLEYGGLEVEGWVDVFRYADSLKFSDELSIPKQWFGLGVKSSQMWSGILGLGYSEVKDLSVLNSMVENNLIETRAFSINVGSWLRNGKPSDSAVPKGSIIFGGVDTKKFSGNLAVRDIVPTPDKKYFVMVDAMGLFANGQQVIQFEGDHFSTLLDTGSTVDWLPGPVINDLEVMLGGEFHHNRFTLPCKLASSNEVIRYNFGGIIIEQKIANLIMDPPAAGQTQCYTRVQPTQDHAILGQPFFEAAYIAFDQDNQKIYLGQSANCDGSTLEPITKDGPFPTKSSCNV